MEPTIKEQIELEKRMVAYGITKYRYSVKAAEEGDRAADTKSAQRLMQSFLDPVAENIRTFCKGKGSGRYGKYKSLLRHIDPNKAAFLTLRAILNHFACTETLTSLGLKIGMMIEDELKFTQFQKEHQEYYNTIIDDFKKKGTKSYRHMHRVLTLKANEKNVTWTNWDRATRCAVGIKLIDCVMESTDLIERGRGESKNNKAAPIIIVPTAQCLDWLQRFNHYAELLHPDRVPCIIPPDPWTDLNQGGYYSPQLRTRTPLVKTRNRRHDTALQESDLTEVMAAVNAIQETEWEVNTDVLNILKEVWNQSLPIGLPQSQPYDIPPCPIEGKSKKEFTTTEKATFENWKAEARMIHTMERERVSKCFQVIRVLRIADEFKSYERLWFVHQCDFRGRIYAAVSGLSPQGPDFAKALLRFHNAKPVGKQGLNWWKIHGANCYGKDKVPYEERIKWVDDNIQILLAAANDPMSHRDVWGNADHPWQFLAWLFEVPGYVSDGDSLLSQLPIGLDGSCNGIQNFSALFRDTRGATVTNIVPGDRPQDIYADVAAVLTEKLRSNVRDYHASEWLKCCGDNDQIPRSLTKRPVMTLPYGSTRQSCREYIYKWMLEEDNPIKPEDRFAMSVYLTPMMWDSINQVVVKARAAMDWLQTCAGNLARAGHPVRWKAPTGFYILQDKKKCKSIQVHTQLAGRFRLRLLEETTKMDVNKQRLGAAPNFVHSLDASHLMLTINQAKAAGVDSFACIHDDYGTHAADTPMLHKCIRESFLRLYTEHDIIGDFINMNNQISLPNPPGIGDLDLSVVKDSRYFFG